MSRRRLSLLVLAGLTALTLPAGAAEPGCSSGLPVTDKRAASYVCTGARAGMALTVPSMKYGDWSCGAGFAFADQYGQKYLSFPGTCFLDYDCLEDAIKDELPPPLNEVVPPLPVCLLPSESELEPVYKRNGPPVKDADGRRVGVIVYAVNKNGVNFALMRVDKGVRLNPALPLYGGPTRLLTSNGTPEEVRVFSSRPFGDVAANARAGYVVDGTGDHVYVATEGILSNSWGSPVMRPNGDALGYFTGALGITGYVTEPYGPALARLQGRTGLKLRLLTAPLAK